MAEYLLAHDLGTSGNKATLYDRQGRLCASCLAEYPTYYPHTGWAEQEPEDWWNAVCTATWALLDQAGVAPRDLAGVSFSGQMMGCVLVDQEGAALRRALIWADTRATEEERAMQAAAGAQRGYRITGHRLSASYGAAKLLWVKNHQPEIYGKAYKMLNAKDYMVQRLTGKFVTDYSDASGTNLFDLKKKQWSGELAEAFGLRRDLLPELHASADVVGRVTPEAARQTGLPEGLPVVLGGGDGSCACVGAGVVKEGRTYCVLGSSSWISMAGAAPVFDPDMRTFNWVHLDPALYTPCGTMQAAGLSLQWFRNAFCGEELRKAKESGGSAYQLIDQMVESVAPGAGGMLYLPYLLGERSPRWDFDASGTFLGFRAGNGRAEAARAVLEGVGYNLKVILNIFDRSEEVPSIEEVALIGGGAKGKVWAQILADIWQKPLVVPRYLEEATSLGAAVCCGVGVGMFPDYSVMDQFNPGESRLLPREENQAAYEALYEIFNQAYQALRPVYKSLNTWSKQQGGSQP